MDCILQSLLRPCLGKSALKSVGDFPDDRVLNQTLRKEVRIKEVWKAVHGL